HSQEEFVETAIELKLKPCLALDIFTPITSLSKPVMHQLDSILLMSVKAGFSGQAFDTSVYPKLKQLREIGFIGGIHIDGGMEPKTIKPCLDAGANIFPVNSYLWSSADINQTLAELRQIR